MTNEKDILERLQKISSQIPVMELGYKKIINSDRATGSDRVESKKMLMWLNGCQSTIEGMKIGIESISKSNEVKNSYYEVLVSMEESTNEIMDNLRKDGLV